MSVLSDGKRGTIVPAQMEAQMKREQYVCLVCGFNMVGFYPDHCPFCGAAKKHFITGEECSARFKVVATPVNKKVTRLNSHQALGIEHAAYRIETGTGACSIRHRQGRGGKARGARRNRRFQGIRHGARQVPEADGARHRPSL